MPTSGKASGVDVLVDTSVAVALLVSDHEHHTATFAALADRHLGLAGHAAFETFSVLTRLPPPARRTPASAHRLLTTNFPGTKFLSPESASALLTELAAQGIAGGSVYDALVGATAAEHHLTLATRDRRAIPTYRNLNITLEILP
jgi:predicted nucleic acid-binding protein